MNVSPHGPRRRHGDHRPPRPALIAPTPAPSVGTPQETLRSIEVALERAQHWRRHVTLVSIALPHGVSAERVAAVSAVVRTVTRAADGMWRDDERSLIVLLADVDGVGSEPALRRLRTALAPFAKDGIQIGRAAAAAGIRAVDLVDLARGDRGDVSAPGEP